MKTKTHNRLAAVFMALAMLLSLIPFEAFVRTTAKADGTPQDFVLDISTEFPETVAAGAWKDGQKVKAGTDKFFSIYMSKKSKVTDNSKSFNEIGKPARKLDLNEKTDLNVPKCAIKFTTGGAATVNVWWAAGDNNRQVAILKEDGSVVQKTAQSSVKNDPYDDTITISEAGTYYLANPDGNNYIIKVNVNTIAPPKPTPVAWSSVATPSITSTAVNGDTITVNVEALVDDVDGGDNVVVEMLENNKVVMTETAQDTNPTVNFKPTKSGDYTFRATLEREGENAKKTSAPSAVVNFTLPLKTPTLTATNKGSGRIELVWTAVPEADKYVINDGSGDIDVAADKTVYTYNGTVDKNYTFTVKAVRGEESATSDSVSIKATAEAVIDWDFVYYGTSTSSSKNKYTENDDGSVTVIATSNGGKIQYDSNYDGLGFYWTRVSATDNFSLKSKVKVDVADSTGSQTGFGLLALDSYPANKNSTTNHYTNQFMVGAYKFHHYWDFENNEVPYGISGTKYTMTHGIGVTRRYNITDSTGNGHLTESFPLDKSHINPANEDGTYQFEYRNGSEFIFEIGRNNTGYYAAYYTPNGRLVNKQQFYDPDALSVLDENSVYVGFFTGRVSTATFSDFELKTWSKASDNTPVEEHPITYVNPAAPISSASVANSSNYTLIMTPNVKGTISVSVNGVEESESITVTTPKTVITKDVTIASGNNDITVTFTPLPTAEQGFESPYIQLRSEESVTSSITVKYDTYYANQKNLYIAPNGKETGNGGKDYPLDIYTAVKVVQPGQTIVVMEGTYNLYQTVTIQRGVDGTANNLIRMIADPDATSRPVFNFGGVGGGIRHGGNYWYFSGFDVTRSADKQTGFRVCGNNNTLDQINTYTNGNTGVQISAFRDSSDPTDMWPQNNLILNCTSYDNADAAGQDADGFAAKLTVGNGNVFDGCAAYNNCDDGWDLFAKPTTGNIGSVTIRNCIAYNNGHNLDNSIRGDGNGFKLGGSNMSGKHVLENSFAFNNDANGITSNSCPDVTVKNCTSYNNASAGLTLYSSTKTEPIDFTVDGVIVCGNSSSVADNTNNKDSQIRNVTTVAESAFESTTFDGLKRKENGTLDLGDFLKLKDAAAGGADFDKEGGSTSSGDVGEITPDENLPAPKPESSGSSGFPSSSGTSDSPSSSDDSSLTFEDDDTEIKVTAPSGAFDNDVKFNAVPITAETNDRTFTFDLSFTDKDGNKVQPKVAVIVKIPVPTALVGKTIYVYHVENDGSYTEISSKVEDGMVVFTASSFSKYIITTEKLVTSNSNPNPNTGVQSHGGLVFTIAGLAAVCSFKRKRRL